MPTPHDDEELDGLNDPLAFGSDPDDWSWNKDDDGWEDAWPGFDDGLDDDGLIDDSPDGAWDGDSDDLDGAWDGDSDDPDGSDRWPSATPPDIMRQTGTSPNPNTEETHE